MICGIHYFITKLKTKIDVIPRSRFENNENIYCADQNTKCKCNSDVKKYYELSEQDAPT